MKLNTNSNVYTIIYSTIVVVIVAVILAFVNQTLKPLQDKNELLDKQKQILGALKVDFAGQDPAKVYESIIATGDTMIFFKPNTTDTVRVFKAHLYDGTLKYVLPLSGKGLWGGIGGYLVLNEDKDEIYGVNFNHESETPGLGAKIVDMEFREKFEGKHIHNAAGMPAPVAVLKAGKKGENGQDVVDAISGATITSSGVSTMLKENLEGYQWFLENKSTVNPASVEAVRKGLQDALLEYMNDLNKEVQDVESED